MTIQPTTLPDLARYRCTRFQMRGRIPSQFGSTPLSDIVGQRVTPRQPLILEEFYSASRQPHHVQVIVGRPSQRVHELIVRIDCLLGDYEEFTDEPTTTINLMNQLTELRFESEFNYDVVFTLGRKAVRKFFPLKLPVVAGTIIDEFRGFRGVKLDHGKIAYQILIDSPDLKDLYVNLEFRRREVFDYDLLHQTIRETASIVEGIIPASDWSE